MGYVLIVDDNEINCKLFVVFLEFFGMLLDVVLLGESVVEFVVVECYDVVLFDLNMLGMSGFEMVKVIRFCFIDGELLMIVVMVVLEIVFDW